MATLKRCDDCKGLSDDPKVGYVSKAHFINEYRNNLAKILVSKDLCATCLKKLVNSNNISESGPDRY